MALGDVPYSLTRENLFPDGCEGFFREVGGEANGKKTQKKAVSLLLLSGYPRIS